MAYENTASSGYKESKSTDKQIRQFFDRYYTNPISYTTEEVDAVIGYFQKRGFDETAAINTAVVLLQQSKIDGLKVFELLDTLKGTTDVQLSNIRLAREPVKKLSRQITS
jgi:hypothetical protein